ncbi:hypothetical protein VNO78_05620 [Psophocarpus tetragonolobus]|uniref:Uncharacterized protein n=1 Tax=Psophocarpus tetragonolobus TaxID=3891 RepID=A0AAN9XQW1_PSOTE
MNRHGFLFNILIQIFVFIVIVTNSPYDVSTCSVLKCDNQYSIGANSAGKCDLRNYLKGLPDSPFHVEVVNQLNQVSMNDGVVMNDEL